MIDAVRGLAASYGTYPCHTGEGRYPEITATVIHTALITKVEKPLCADFY